jgi:hypothetical protein
VLDFKGQVRFQAYFRCSLKAAPGEEAQDLEGVEGEGTGEGIAAAAGGTEDAAQERAEEVGDGAEGDVAGEAGVQLRLEAGEDEEVHLEIAEAQGGVWLLREAGECIAEERIQAQILQAFAAELVYKLRGVDAAGGAPEVAAEADVGGNGLRLGDDIEAAAPLGDEDFAAHKGLQVAAQVAFDAAHALGNGADFAVVGRIKG